MGRTIDDVWRDLSAVIDRVLAAATEDDGDLFYAGKELAARRDEFAYYADLPKSERNRDVPDGG